jgi:hypothetical protein
MHFEKWTPFVLVIIFNLVQFLLKNVIKLIFLKKHQNQFKPTGFGSVLEQKPVQTGLTRFFRFDSVFSGFFSVWVRFGFFDFRLIKQNRSVFSKF